MVAFKGRLKNYGVFLAVSLLLGVSFSPVLRALEDDSNTSFRQESSSVDDQQTRNERLRDLRAKHKIRLSTLRQRIITTRCNLAQVKLTDLGVRFEAISAKRERIYATIDSRLDLIIARLENLGADITGLTKLKQTFDHQFTDLLELFSMYQQALGDLAELDCSEEPASFQAALVEAKDLIVSIKVLTRDLHSLIRGDIQKQLISLARSIQEARSE